MPATTAARRLPDVAAVLGLAVGAGMLLTACLGLSATPSIAAAAESDPTAAVHVLQEVSAPVVVSSTSTSTGAPATPTGQPATTAAAATVSVLPPTENQIRFTITTAPGGMFTTGSGALPNADKALARALSFVGNAAGACTDGQCLQLCDHLAGAVWGYQDSSGYDSALTHWASAIASGDAHPGDTAPPLGALLFFSGGEFGHVMTYMGGGMAVSNYGAGPAGSGVYLLPADLFVNQKRDNYLGWANPVFHGQAVGAAL